MLNIRRTYINYLIIYYHFFDTSGCKNEIPSKCTDQLKSIPCELLFETYDVKMCDRTWASSPLCDKAPKQLTVKETCQRSCNDCEGKFLFVIVFLE